MNTHQINVEALEDNFWKRPQCYIGQEYNDYIVVYSRTRDSSILENVNYETILETLERDSRMSSSSIDDDELVFDVRDSHWACGWVEYILVSKYASERVLCAVYEILRALSNYPVLCDETYSNACYDAILNHWESADTEDRIEMCDSASESIFAARRNEIPEGVFDYLSGCEGFY